MANIIISGHLPVPIINSLFFQTRSALPFQRNHVEEFDFIIVGGGSAGSVLANRLSQKASYSVLLLEAGGNLNPVQNVPFLFNTILHNRQVDYDFYTVPQTNACLALKEQRSFWPRGRGLGGCSNLNNMYYQRGNKNDYKRWGELSGDEQWTFENVLRNLKNIEDYHGAYPDENWHSSNGNGVYVATSSEKRLLKQFLAAGKEMGYPTKDVNGLQEAAFTMMDVTIKDGRRFGAYTAFLKPVISRKNLQIYRYSRAQRIHFDKKMTALGVAYKRHGVSRFVKARKEIILSAGAVDSPKLLMLSGIGPKRHLEELGIGCLVDLPVGQNLMDHVTILVGPFTVDTPNTSFKTDRDFNLSSIVTYFTSRTGVLATPMTANGVAYIHSDTALKKMKKAKNSTLAKNISPDIQLVLLPIAPSLTGAVVLEKSFSLKENVLKSYFSKAADKDGFLIMVMLGKPQSRGEMRLSSPNPVDRPILNPKYFSHPQDVRLLVEGINFTVTMVENTQAFKKHGARLIDSHLPGCENYVLRSFEYYECYARHFTLTMYHPSGTATMGKKLDDSKAVVDSNLRVLNTKRLRVVDASVIPEIPNSNLNAAVLMLADKASELILDYWNKQ